MRPRCKARRPSIPGVCEGGATQQRGMQRRPNAEGFRDRTTHDLRLSVAAPALVALVAWSVLAFGGVYLSTAIPIVVGAFLLAVGARPAIASADERLLDWWLIALLAAGLFQVLPLPASVVRALSPNASAFHEAYRLDSVTGRGFWDAISIDRAASWYALALMASAVLVFWVARDVLRHRGLRLMVRSIAWLGLGIAIFAVVQRATSKGLIYWRFKPLHPGAQPLGPMVNKNDMATWLLLALPLSVGYLMMRVEARRTTRLSRAIDTRLLWLLAAAAAMILLLFLSLSRSGLLGLAAAAIGALILTHARIRRRTGSLLTVYGVLAVAAIAAWVNLSAIVARFDVTDGANGIGRLAVWRDSAGVVRDFWPVGTGLGTYVTAMRVYQQHDRTFYYNHAHNDYLQLATDGGLLLAIPAVAALITFARLARRRLASDRSPVFWVRAGAISSMIAVAVQSVWDTGLRVPANAVLCAVVAAIAVHPPTGSVSPRVEHDGGDLS
jgi:O-antigen ligase